MESKKGMWNMEKQKLYEKGLENYPSVYSKRNRAITNLEWNWRVWPGGYWQLFQSSPFQLRCFCTGDLPYDEAKKKLITIKGIGPKTADVFLMAIKGEQVLPIDVHIFRIMKRLKIASERDDYESLRAKLESEIPPAQRTKTHLILIEFGRRICRSQNPKCEECPIKRYCEAGKNDFAIPNI